MATPAFFYPVNGQGAERAAHQPDRGRALGLAGGPPKKTGALGRRSVSLNVAAVFYSDVSFAAQLRMPACSTVLTMPMAFRLLAVSFMQRRY